MQHRRHYRFLQLWILALGSGACSLELPAVSTERCATNPDPLTRGLWRFEEANDKELKDSANEHTATIVGQEGTDWNRGPGPEGCGSALELTAHEELAYAKIPHHDHWNLQRGSVELWVRFANKLPSKENKGVEGILSRDAHLYGRPGHFLIFRACDGRIIVRLQRTNESYYVCSDPITKADWHHLGINFGGGPLELFVNGQRATNKNPFTCSVPPGPLPCGTGDRTTAGIDGNENPWVIGAVTWSSEEGSSEVTAAHSLNGAIDQLQIRSDHWDFE